jgi:signal transduction histidine kinase
MRINNKQTRVNEATKEKRGKILEALSATAEYFLRATPEAWEKNVVEVLKRLGEARESGRVYLCKNFGDNETELKVLLRYEWKQRGKELSFPDDPAQGKTYFELGLGRWISILRSGKPICERVANLPPEEQGWNVAPEAQMIVIIPVFVGDEWWGYLGFEDWQAEGQCSKYELDALKAVAITFGEAIKRKRIEEELKKEKEKIEERVLERTRELREKTAALERAQREVEHTLTNMKEEKAKLTASIHSLSMGFLMTDLQGGVVLFNHAVSDILGKIDGYWNLGLLEAKLGGNLSIAAHIRQSIEEVKEIYVDEINFQDKFLKITFTPIRMLEVDGRVIGVVILIADMTDAKNLQRARDEFFAVAAHELRTPLTAIKGYAEMIEHYYPRSVEDPKVREMMGDIRVSSSRLLELVSEYLDTSRVEMQKVQVVKETFDVVAKVRQAMADLAISAKNKQLVWEMQVTDSEEIYVTADPGRTVQILINFLGNAIKNTDIGGVYVKVKREGSVVRTYCYDTGVGIAVEEQAHLFQKFRQLGDRVYARDVTSGTGMGLYISRLLAEAMGGRVYLEKSAPGEGSGFVLELPAA